MFLIASLYLMGCSETTEKPVDTASDVVLGECVPVPACDTDLDVVCGSILPDVGEIPENGDYGYSPQEQGPHEFSEEEYTLELNGSIAVGIFTPTLSEALPLVLVLPAFGQSYTAYRHMTTHLASHGFLVVGADVSPGSFMDPAEHDKKAQNVTSVIDWILSQDMEVDQTKIAVMGHSLGGKLAFYAASFDDRIDIVTGWDPQNNGGPPCFLGQTEQGECNDFPVAPNCQAEDSGLIHNIQAESLIFGAQDSFLTPDVHLHASEFYRGAPSPAHFISMPAVGHLAWSAEDSESLFTRGVHTSLLLNRFKGYEGLDEWIPGQGLMASESFIDDIRSK